MCKNMLVAGRVLRQAHPLTIMTIVRDHPPARLHSALEVALRDGPTRATVAAAGPRVDARFHLGGKSPAGGRRGSGEVSARTAAWGGAFCLALVGHLTSPNPVGRAPSSFKSCFGWPFPSQDGPPEKKCHLESGLNQRDRAECEKSYAWRYVGSPAAGARSKTPTWGVLGWLMVGSCRILQLQLESSVALRSLLRFPAFSQKEQIAGPFFCCCVFLPFLKRFFTALCIGLWLRAGVAVLMGHQAQ